MISLRPGLCAFWRFLRVFDRAQQKTRRQPCEFFENDRKNIRRCRVGTFAVKPFKNRWVIDRIRRVLPFITPFASRLDRFSAMLRSCGQRAAIPEGCLSV